MKNLTFLKLNKLLHFFFFADGLTHWLVQRIAAASILTCSVLIFLLDNYSLFILLPVLLFFHVFAGIRTLLDDYIHDLILFLISSIYLRISIIYFLKTLFLIFLC